MLFPVKSNTREAAMELLGKGVGFGAKRAHYGARRVAEKAMEYKDALPCIFRPMNRPSTLQEAEAKR